MEAAGLLGVVVSEGALVGVNAGEVGVSDLLDDGFGLFAGPGPGGDVGVGGAELADDGRIGGLCAGGPLARRAERSGSPVVASRVRW